MIAKSVNYSGRFFSTGLSSVSGSNFFCGVGSPVLIPARTGLRRNMNQAVLPEKSKVKGGWYD